MLITNPSHPHVGKILLSRPHDPNGTDKPSTQPGNALNLRS